MSRVFANGPRDRGSISGRFIPKTQKMVLHAALLSTQHYKAMIMGKLEQSWEWSSALPYTSVLLQLKRKPLDHPRLRSPTLLTLLDLRIGKSLISAARDNKNIITSVESVSWLIRLGNKQKIFCFSVSLSLSLSHSLSLSLSLSVFLFRASSMKGIIKQDFFCNDENVSKNIFVFLLQSLFYPPNLIFCLSCSFLKDNREATKLITFNWIFSH